MANKKARARGSKHPITVPRKSSGPVKKLVTVTDVVTLRPGEPVCTRMSRHVPSSAHAAHASAQR